MVKQHFNISLRGKVQGVGFRYSAKQKADELGLMGYARNLWDGSVFIEAEGEAKALDEFARWLKAGPGLSRVDTVSIEAGKVAGYREFAIY